MKGGRRTSKGRIINIDDVIAASPHATAVGNMRVNAQGDEIGPGGKVTKTREQRTRAYYKDHPQSSNRKVSLKGDMPGQMESPGRSDFSGLKPDTADTGYENVRTEDHSSAYHDEDTTNIPDVDGGASPVINDPDLSEPEAPEPEEFDAPELDENGDYVEPPTGYREVEQENGDIVMQPYWDDDDES